MTKAPGVPASSPLRRLLGLIAVVVALAALALPGLAQPGRRPRCRSPRS